MTDECCMGTSSGTYFQTCAGFFNGHKQFLNE